jgi:predicted DCC family thiol-disulfide oxidoreductase YuxK
MMDEQSQTTVFYDGACPLCRAEIQHYRNVDSNGRLTFVDVSGDRTALQTGMPREALLLLARFHVMRGDGTVLSGARAFVHVWRQLPGWRWFGYIAALPGFVHAIEIFYRVFLPLRPLIVRLFGRFRALST